jgi:hypothetical protein
VSEPGSRYEVWAGETLDVPYLLIVRPAADGYEVRDPADGRRVVYASKSLDDVRFWLSEDEYTLVARKIVDE